MPLTTVQDLARYGPLLNVASLSEPEATFVLSNPRNFPYLMKVQLRVSRFYSPATFLTVRVVIDDHSSKMYEPQRGFEATSRIS